MRAVVMAAGRGTRMRAPVPELSLSPEQERAAAAGLKALIPIGAHPFLSYTLSALADAGYSEVCLIVRPGEDPIREFYERSPTTRLQITFAVQEEPLGTAHALLAAEPFITGGHFLVINGDNYYPASVLACLREAPGPALAGFSASALHRDGNIPADRIAAFALVVSDEDGYLTQIVEKPDDEVRLALAGRSLVSMTCWHFGPEIFEAARSIPLSPRGEYELPDAVTHAITELGQDFQVLPFDEPVLDLSRRGDIRGVEEHLRGVEVRL